MTREGIAIWPPVSPLQEQQWLSTFIAEGSGCVASVGVWMTSPQETAPATLKGLTKRPPPGSRPCTSLQKPSGEQVSASFTYRFASPITLRRYIEPGTAAEKHGYHRYMYNESLGRWRTADLLIGLAYLARQETAQQAVADIACTGHLVGQGRSKQERLEIIVSDCTGSTGLQL